MNFKVARRQQIIRHSKLYPKALKFLFEKKKKKMKKKKENDRRLLLTWTSSIEQK